MVKPVTMRKSGTTINTAYKLAVASGRFVVVGAVPVEDRVLFAECGNISVGIADRIVAN